MLTNRPLAWCTLVRIFGVPLPPQQMPNAYELRIGRSRYTDFAFGLQRCDFLPEPNVDVNDVLVYREYDYIEAYYTGRKLTFRVQKVDRGPALGIPQGYVMVSLDSSVGGITCRDLANAYETVRMQSMEPDCERYVQRVIQSSGDPVSILGTIVRITDAVFSRLIPNGNVVRWYNLVQGPAAGARVAEVELGALNTIFEDRGKYEPMGDVAQWVDR